MLIHINNYTDEMINLWDNFVLNQSLNGTIYHTQMFLSYHKNKFNDKSILIYNNNELVGVFPCCEINGDFYSHKGSTCGGLVILEKYYELDKLILIMDEIYKFYNGNLYIKLSENIYFANKNNELMNFVLSLKCKKEQDISMFFNIKKKENIIDNIPKSDNKRLLMKYINNNINNDIKINISTNINDYKEFYILLEKYLMEKNMVKPLHTLDEFLLLKEILNDNQFLLLAKNNTNQIVSGAFIFKINKNIYYTVYLMTNYEIKGAHIIYLLYELFILAKNNSCDIVNLGACSINGSKNILNSKYKLKFGCGCDPCLKYSFTYKNPKDDLLYLTTEFITLKKMIRDEQYLIAKLWNNNNHAYNMFFYKNNNITFESQITWFDNNNNSNIKLLSIYENKYNDFIGYCGIKNIINNSCEIFLVILDQKYYGLGYGSDTLKLLIDYINNVLTIRKIHLIVKKINTNAIKLYKKFNFNIKDEDNINYTMELD
jgi:RimJ/RimL family protein N-acetyltransferase